MTSEINSVRDMDDFESRVSLLREKMGPISKSTEEEIKSLQQTVSLASICEEETHSSSDCADICANLNHRSESLQALSTHSQSRIQHEGIQEQSHLGTQTTQFLDAFITALKEMHMSHLASDSPLPKSFHRTSSITSEEYTNMIVDDQTQSTKQAEKRSMRPMKTTDGKNFVDWVTHKYSILPKDIVQTHRPTVHCKIKFYRW